MFVHKTAKFAPVWTTILKIQAIFVHQTEHALFEGWTCNLWNTFRGTWQMRPFQGSAYKITDKE